MTRSTPEYAKITKSPDLFKCQNGCEEVIKGLTPYRKYLFQIAAGTKIGLGSFSNPKEILTAQAGTVFYVTVKAPLSVIEPLGGLFNFGHSRGGLLREGAYSQN